MQNYEKNINWPNFFLCNNTKRMLVLSILFVYYFTVGLSAAATAVAGAAALATAIAFAAAVAIKAITESINNRGGQRGHFFLPFIIKHYSHSYLITPFL